MGIFNQTRYLNLLYTIKDIVEHFPIEQFPITYEFGTSGADGWTGNVTYQTLILDRMRYDIANNPDFSQTTIIGYYPEGEYTGLVAPNLILPANMYTGPIIPDSFENVPVTVVAFEFTKGTEKFSKQLLLIENWTIGVDIGDPRNHPDFSPVDGLPSTLLLTVDKNLILTGDTLTFFAESDIPQTESIPASSTIRFFRRTSPTTQVLIANQPVVNRTASATISTNTLSTGTATFFATFAGNIRYGFTTSNNVNVDVVRGRGLDVKLNLNPTTSIINTTIEAVATATIVAGDAFTATQFIDNTTTFRVLARSPYSGENTNPVNKTGVFTDGRYETTFVSDTSYLPTNVSSATYTVNSVVGTVSTLTFNTTIIKDFDVQLNWEPLYEHLIRGGTTSTIYTINTTQNVVRNLTPLTVDAYSDDSFPNGVTEVYNNTIVTLRAVSNVGRNQNLTNTAVEFFARYNPSYNILDYTSPRTPEQAASTSSSIVVMPTRLQNNQVLLQTPSAVKVGADFRMPTDIPILSSASPSWQVGDPGRVPVKVVTNDSLWWASARQAIQKINENSAVFTATYVITSATTITSGLNSGTVLVTLNENLPKNAYHASYNTTTNASLTLDTFRVVQPFQQVFTGEFNSGWVAEPANISANELPGFQMPNRLSWGSRWFDTTTLQNYTIRRGPTWDGLTNYTEAQISALSGFFRGANTGYWIHYVWSDHQPFTLFPSTAYKNTVPPFVGSATVHLNGTFTYNPYQEALVGMYSENEPFEYLPEFAPSPTLTTLPQRTDSDSQLFLYQKSRIVNLQNYTVDTSGALQGNTDALYFTSIPNVTTGTQFTLSGLVNTGNTNVIYSVFEVGNNYLRADPPWYNHVPAGFDNGELHNKSIIFNKPNSTEQTKFSLVQLTELKYIGVGIPYFTGAYNFNKVKFSTPVSVNATFKIHGGSKSPVNSVFTVASGPDNEGFYTINPAYSITEYTESEQWRRDNEIFNNFQTFERNRNIVVFTDPIVSNKFLVRSARNDNKLVLDNITNNLRPNATFTANLSNFTGTYTIISIDPLLEAITVSPAWTNSQLGLLNQWVNTEFTFTNAVLTTSTISLGVANEYYVSNDFTTTWLRPTTLPTGTYQLSARITRAITTGSNAPLDYSSSSTVSFNMQSAPGLIAPIDLTYVATNSTQTTIIVSARGSTSVDLDHYYVFEEPAELYSNNILIASSPWTRVAGAIEQRASILVDNTVLLNESEIRWAGSMNYQRQFDDQYLFQPAILTLPKTETINTLRPIWFTSNRYIPQLNLGAILEDSRSGSNSVPPYIFVDGIYQNYIWENYGLYNNISISNTIGITGLANGQIDYTRYKGQINRTTGNYERVAQIDTLPSRNVINGADQIFEGSSRLSGRINVLDPLSDSKVSLTPKLDIGQIQGHPSGLYFIDTAKHFNGYVENESFFNGNIFQNSSYSLNQIIRLLPQNYPYQNNGNGHVTTSTVYEQSGVNRYYKRYNEANISGYRIDPNNLDIWYPGFIQKLPVADSFLPNNPYQPDNDVQRLFGPIPLTQNQINGNWSPPGFYACYEQTFLLMAEPKSIWDPAQDIRNCNITLNWYRIFDIYNSFVASGYYFDRVFPQGAITTNLFRGAEFVTIDDVYIDGNHRMIKSIKVRKYFNLFRNSPQATRDKIKSLNLSMSISWPTATNAITFSIINSEIPNFPTASKIYYA